MRNKINLIGMKDINEFLSIINGVEGRIEIFNPKTGHRVSGRSMLGLIMASSEWGDNLWIDSERDIYGLIEKFVGEDDSVKYHD